VIGTDQYQSFQINGTELVNLKISKKNSELYFVLYSDVYKLGNYFRMRFSKPFQVINAIGCMEFSCRLQKNFR
jgi:hypothetical protein